MAQLCDGFWLLSGCDSFISGWKNSKSEVLNGNSSNVKMTEKKESDLYTDIVFI